MKRTFDLITSFLFLILLLPLFLFISLVIILDSKGMPFYIQKRVGKNNKDFGMFKFRTMHINADKQGFLTIGGKDKRITKVGFFLRKYKIDELPQLINVFAGEMSFVGPRPEVRKYVDFYCETQKKVLSVKPGITDWASLEYIDENNLLLKAEDPEQLYINQIMPHKLELNLEYIAKRSFILDMLIIIKTLKKIVF